MTRHGSSLPKVESDEIKLNAALRALLTKLRTLV
jgi:hypothetical protein